MWSKYRYLCGSTCFGVLLQKGVCYGITYLHYISIRSLHFVHMHWKGNIAFETISQSVTNVIQLCCFPLCKHENYGPDCLGYMSVQCKI